MTKKTTRPDDIADHVVVTVEINARSGQIEVTTLQRGSGRHIRYHTLNQVPPELRGEALGLIRRAVLDAGYESLQALDEALTSEIVLPEESAEEQTSD